MFEPGKMDPGFREDDDGEDPRFREDAGPA